MFNEDNILHGDCLKWIAEALPDHCIDSIVTDPPAGISFMGKHWDSDKGGRDHWIKWMQEVAAECLRVIKPGGHALVWALPRTSHWTATAWENGGWDVRDIVSHLFGTGFPKNLDVSKAIDRELGAEREVLGQKVTDTMYSQNGSLNSENGWLSGQDLVDVSAPSSHEARQWDGWGTSLKPATEHWILFRAPLSEKTVARNVLQHGTGGLNVDACRVHHDEPLGFAAAQPGGDKVYGQSGRRTDTTQLKSSGRWPANVCHDGSDTVLEAFAAFGSSKSMSKDTARFENKNGVTKGPALGGVKGGFDKKAIGNMIGYGDQGSVARFFYTAKASKRDRITRIIEEIIVEWNSDQKSNRVLLQVDMEQLRLKVIDGSVSKENDEWNTFLSGNTIMDRFPKDSKFIIGTKTKSTTESKTLNSLTHSLTNDCTADVNYETENGINHAANVEQSITSLTIIPAETVYLPGANHVLGGTPLKITSNVRQHSHPTVKSVKLMEYLITLITPPGGTVLDPFSGSGTTGEAALKLGFECILIEQEAEYIEDIKRRLAAWLPKKQLIRRPPVFTQEI